MSAATVADDLLSRIRQKRADVERFLASSQPRKRRLLNITIGAGTIAAALTAAPAVGGQSLTAWLTKTFGLVAPSWQLLCAAASVCSVMATIATQVLKSQNIEEHVAKAQACRAKLEVLEIGLGLGHLDLPQATKEYIRCVEDAAFLDSAA